MKKKPSKHWRSFAGNRTRIELTLAGLALLLSGIARADDTHYELVASMEPSTSRLLVDATIDFPAEQAGQAIEFLLTGRLVVSDSEPAVELLEESGDEGFQGINGSSTELARRAGIKRYRVQLPPGSSSLRLRYSGNIDFPLETQGEEYSRGFRETPGIIEPEGVYLAGSTLWYPYFDTRLVSFNLQARVPPDWRLISQGDGTSLGPDGIARWNSAGLVDEIYLVGGPLIRYEEAAGAATAEVYLREPDPALAAKYLEATARYIEMYRKLIGPYPYGKFALVENFWETGYGMPSFTLLGPQIIRFPFILTSSYPHEILHNWWGNSVFVDYGTGNWCEGLTAYMADHLIKEQQGQGAEYRRDVLKKYRNFVQSDRDFPLTEFRSRHSAATEAVGYGKTMMGFHMLRLRVGDDNFRKALQSFYRKQRGRQAGFQDLRGEFESASGQDLERFFREWTTLTGAADIGVEDLRVQPDGEDFMLSGKLLQRQPQGPFELRVPIALTTEAGDTRVETVSTDSAVTTFTIRTRERPVLLSVDPQFDVFRRLDVRETAPSIGQLFGDREVLAVLPAAADEESRDTYAALAGIWDNPAQAVQTVLDSELESLPDDRGIWLFGAENRFAGDLFSGDRIARLEIDGDGIRIAGEDVPFAGHSTVVLTRNPANAARAVGWITADPPAAADGIARKLPHYGKYSYLVFAGDEPANIMKGEWTAADSPMLFELGGAESSNATPVQAEYPARPPLAELPSIFSRERLLADVDWLAAAEREGRGVGTAGLEAAAEYLAAQFADIGLEPAGDDGGYLQSFTIETGPEGGPNTLANVIGYVPGADPRFANQAVVVSAHYDHLGYGWPDERAQAEPGALYPGADDNASGVAVLLELARAYASGAPPPRTLVFLALSGEEAGLRGSEYYVEHPRPVPIDGIIAVVNMDTVGRLGDQPVSILAAESATEWPHVFRGIGFTTGIQTKIVPGATASSDQQSFINAGVPGVQIFSGVHLDYHRPSDTPDKVDGDGMVRVATVVREATDYLLARESPLTVTGEGVSDTTATQTRASASGNRRRVSFGTVPDFSWQGAGVRVESVVPGSPAEVAGIRAGDLIQSLDGDSVADLGAFSEMLKRYSAGDRVRATGQRGDSKFEVELVLVAR